MLEVLLVVAEDPVIDYSASTEIAINIPLVMIVMISGCCTQRIQLQGIAIELIPWVAETGPNDFQRANCQKRIEVEIASEHHARYPQGKHVAKYELNWMSVLSTYAYTLIVLMMQFMHVFVPVGGVKESVGCEKYKVVYNGAEVVLPVESPHWRQIFHLKGMNHFIVVQEHIQKEDTRDYHHVI